MKIMKKGTKNFLVIAGIISIGMGILGAIPSFLKEMYGVATASASLIILGLVLLGLAFSD